MVSNISFRRLFSNSNLSSPLWHAVTGGMGMGWIGWRDSLTREEFVGSAHPPHPPLNSQRGVRQTTIMPSAMSLTLSSSMFTINHLNKSPSSSSPPLTERSQATSHAIRDVIDTVIIDVYPNHPNKSYAYVTVVQRGYLILSS